MSGDCKASAPVGTAKWDSKVIHIWQCILPLKTLTVEVEEICIKRLKTNLQSFWIRKCFCSMQWLCCIHPNANNLCSKGTLGLWQKSNNLQNSMLSMMFGGQKDGERKMATAKPWISCCISRARQKKNLNAYTNWRARPPQPLFHSQHGRAKRPDRAEPPFTSALKRGHTKCIFWWKNLNMTVVVPRSTITFEWLVSFPFYMIKI